MRQTSTTTVELNSILPMDIAATIFIFLPYSVDIHAIAQQKFRECTELEYICMAFHFEYIYSCSFVVLLFKTIFVFLKYTIGFAPMLAIKC